MESIDNKIEIALDRLNSIKTGEYTYLGRGATSVVFHFDEIVYRVFFQGNLATNTPKKYLLQYLKDIHVCPKHMYQVKEIIELKDCQILTYPYEPSEPCQSFNAEEILDFLVECWNYKIVFKDVKPKNFVRVNGKLKFIDLDPDTYSDNLFLNMIVRAFIYSQPYNDLTKQKLCRTAINNFDIPELEGVREFIHSVFQRIASKHPIENTSTKVKTYGKAIPSKLGEQVTLLIKVCAQDSHIVYQAVKHIVKQSQMPDGFFEVIIAIDTKVDNFIRQYNEKGDNQQLLFEINRLISEDYADRYVLAETEEIMSVNQKWFGLTTSHSHSIQGVPVSTQLHAFDAVKTRYVLQVDCDAIVGRRNFNHSYLADMLEALHENEKVVSVGFNIYHEDMDFVPYFGLENGGFVPEVRFGLLDMQRIKSFLPLENYDSEKGLELTWYRSLEKRQKESGFVSIRGGSCDSFYIHPPNFRKKDKDVWFTIVDRVEQLEIPKVQSGEFDLKGSYYDWTTPKRNESIVVVAYFDQLDTTQLTQHVNSLNLQTIESWGLIIINDNDQIELRKSMELFKTFSERVTIINNKYRLGELASIYKAIHYFLENDNTIVVIVPTTGAFLGNNVLSKIYEKHQYWKGDLVIGKTFYKDSTHPLYIKPPNLVSPRTIYSNLDVPPLSFNKYLFDSLRFEDIKVRNPQENWAEGILLSKRFTQQWVFPEKHGIMSLVIPLVELASNPKVTDHFNYYLPIKAPTIDEGDATVKEILKKKSKQPSEVVIGRKSFKPNLSKIELDITYDCNLKCINCNRSSTQAPTKEGMTLEQVDTFIGDSIELGIKWELINILGGEPTLHLQFIEIIECILNKYLIPYSPDTILQITSNGHGTLVQNQLNRLPKHPNLIVDYNSFKDDKRVPYFTPFNDAPIDNDSHGDIEYHKGCWVTSYCGIGLNHLGYYACGVAGGIDRVMGLDKGIKSLAEVEGNIERHLLDFCRYCGNFSDYAVNKGDFIPRNEKDTLVNPVISKTWSQVYKKYNAEQKSHTAT